MTYAIVLVGTGMLVGAGLYLIVRALTPTDPQLAGALDRLSPEQVTRRDQVVEAPVNSRDAREVVGAFLERRLSGRPGFTPPLQDLAVLGRTVRSYWGEKGAAAGIGFFGVIAIQVALSLGLGELLPFTIPFTIPALLAIALAALLWFLPDYTIRDQAAQARRDLLRAAISYCQQVAIHRRAQASAAGAMREAAEVSDGWMFVRIREELHRAQVTGVPAWDGLDRLAERTGTPELAEVGDIMRLAGDSGAAVYETLLGRAKSLNDALLAAEHRDSLVRAESIHGPVGLLPGILVLLILYPALMTLVGT